MDAHDVRSTRVEPRPAPRRGRPLTSPKSFAAGFMNAPAIPRALVLLLSVACIGIGWRLVILARADVFADTDPGVAVRLVPAHPGALASLANYQIATGQPEAALETARRLLEREPVDGRGFAAAAVARAQMGGADALHLHALAARRAPRDLRVRAWLVETLIEDRRYADALGHVEAILRLSPRHADVLLPWLVALGTDPAFADALAAELAAAPRWRPALLAGLLSAADMAAADRVLEALQRRGSLRDAERREWIRALLARDRWGMALAIEMHAIGDDGGAAIQPYVTDPGSGVLAAASNAGFGWQQPDRPGVRMRLVEPQGQDTDPALHVSFPGRPPGVVLLEHPLLLPPGGYRLGMRMRTMALRDERRLAWTVTCDEGGRILGATAPFPGTQDWHGASFDLEVPANGCDRQWLQFRHDDPAGLRSVSGELWVSALGLDGSLADTRGPIASPGMATLVPEQGTAWIGGADGYAPVHAGHEVSVGEQVVLPTAAVASLSADNACTRRYHGPGTFRVGTGCNLRRIDPAAGHGAGGSDAAEAGHGIADAIIGAIDPRGPIPAGR